MIIIKPTARSQAFELTKENDNPLDLSNHLPFRIAVVSNLLALNRDWKIRNLCELDPREIRVLLNIGSYMPIKSADIAYQSRLDSYTVSRAVKKLLALDLIKTQADSHKKNVKNLLLNNKGKAIYQQVVSAMDARSKQLESVLSEDELRLLYSMLEKVENKAEQLLAQQATELILEGFDAPADQKELIRWYKKSSS
ncbi:MarR family winged helix-turn-helix transcriptional regulator [Thalassotalea castellviae]|uniref:MarR family winged helix-turn-helix transcriptional regulator n=1 Tax=Thalassotalea castellviae TaxID=3075612 RepID=A0ABU2ZXW9_9GAMM|nr:MarR family winged helix-turn-helix transcriptional regulator [Thalassotalea sp. W431]MDT0602478.1 MarR family winged helix-turn-helix transcriptional regulator [Thalassotalea sp. W431]